MDYHPRRLVAFEFYRGRVPAKAVLFFLFRQLLALIVFSKVASKATTELPQSVLFYLFILSLVAMVLGFAGYVFAQFGPTPPPDSVSVSLPDGLSFKAAAELIASTESRTVTFKACSETLTEAKVKGGRLTGRTAKEILDALRHKLVVPIADPYEVYDLEEAGVYEIRCN